MKKISANTKMNLSDDTIREIAKNYVDDWILHIEDSYEATGIIDLGMLIYDDELSYEYDDVANTELSQDDQNRLTQEIYSILNRFREML